MSENIVWFKPKHVEALRDTALSYGAEYLQPRNDALIATMYDTGLRVGEVVKLRVTHFNSQEGQLFIPTEIQKDYPTEGSPPPATIALKSDTTRTLKTYLRNRWKDSEYIFPSRTSPSMTTQAVRNAFNKLAKEGDIRPMKLDEKRGWVEGTPDDVNTHIMRHSVAYRMLEGEEENDIYDVRNRLRHKQLQTTIDTYAHFEAV